MWDVAIAEEMKKKHIAEHVEKKSVQKITGQYHQNTQKT